MFFINMRNYSLLFKENLILSEDYNIENKKNNYRKLKRNHKLIKT